MLHLFTPYETLFHTWQVKRYEQEGTSYLLKISVALVDNSHLEIRDYLFQDDRRNMSIIWIEEDGRLRRRWDNALIKIRAHISAIPE